MSNKMGMPQRILKVADILRAKVQVFLHLEANRTELNTLVGELKIKNRLLTEECDEFITKPISRLLLLTKMSLYLDRQAIPYNNVRNNQNTNR